jgi:hypothetical protein
MGAGFRGHEQFFALDRDTQELWIDHWINRRSGAYDTKENADTPQTLEEGIEAERIWAERRNNVNGRN